MENSTLALKYRPTKLADLIGQEITATTLTNAFKDNKLYQGIIFAGNMGTGKCISGDSLVFTTDGIKKIKDLVKSSPGVGNINLKVIDENGIGISSHSYFEKDAKTIKITTRDGFSLEGTPEHPIRIIDENGDIVWEKLEHIAKGDFVSIYRKPFQWKSDNKINFQFDLDDYLSKRFGDDIKIECKICGKMYGNLQTHIPLHGMNCDEYKLKYNSPIYSPDCLKKNAKKSITLPFIPKKFNKKIARLIGFIVSEGHVSDDGVYISNSCDQVKKDIFDSLKIFRPNVSKCVDKRRNNLETIRINSIPLALFFKEMGCGGYSANKRIPNCVFTFSKNLLVEFLRAYFEGDGYVGNSIVACNSSSRGINV